MKLPLLSSLLEMMNAPLVRKVGSGFDAYYAFSDNGLDYQVTGRAFMKKARDSQGEHFLAYAHDSSSGQSIVHDFPVDGEFGQQIVKMLQDEGYDMSFIQKQQPSDYTDQRMRSAENGQI